MQCQKPKGQVAVSLYWQMWTNVNSEWMWKVHHFKKNVSGHWATHNARPSTHTSTKEKDMISKYPGKVKVHTSHHLSRSSAQRYSQLHWPFWRRNGFQDKLYTRHICYEVSLYLGEIGGKCLIYIDIFNLGSTTIKSVMPFVKLFQQDPAF